ncbi:MAG: hypothetical protein ACJA08_000275 [Cyclobacteriaceae bacterium]|jgi:hypothetical protein
MKQLSLLTLLSISLSVFSQSQSPNAWLTGTWKGPGFGGTMEEIWSEPDADGKLMGMFRYSYSSGVVQFYEFWVLDDSGMKLKHFTP